MQLRNLAIAALAGILVACGGGGGGSSGDSPAASTDRVSLTASGSTVPVPGASNTDLDFIVANPAANPATDVALSVTLGSGLIQAGLQCEALGGASCPADSSAMSVKTLPAGGSLHFKMSVTVAAGATGTITSKATVAASNDPVLTNNEAQVSVQVYSTDVSVTGSTSATDLYNGDSITYAYTVSNAGPDAASNVALDNAFTSGQATTAMTCTAGGGATCPADTGASMVIPSLPSGGSLSFSVIARLAMNAVVSVGDTVTATSPGDQNAGNNTAAISAKTRIPTSPNSPSFVNLQSDVGDYIGAGQSYSYDRSNSVLEVYESGGILNIKVNGDETWMGMFYMPGSMAGKLQKGSYAYALGYPLAAGGFTWTGEGRGCNSSSWIKVDDVVRTSGSLASVDLRFELHCEGVAAALRGQIHWVAGDETRPPGPVNPPPAGLWQPAGGATPSSGNYVYIESDQGDFIGQGRTETYTQSNAVLSVSETSGVLGVSLVGDRNYLGSFKAMTPLTQVAPGYYPNAQRWPFGNPAVGALDFSGDGRGCNVLSGWFVIDSITLSGSTVTAVDLRFEQHCENNAAALRGQVHWRSGDPTQPAGPQQPPPPGLWAPPSGAVAATGNVVYLQSDPGDYIGGGLSKVYSPLDSVITVGGGGMTAAGNRFQLTVQGDEEWTGYFQAMNTLQDLQPGYYAGLQRFPFNNPTVGGIDWSGEGRGCNQITGWFVIDSVSYAGSTLSSIQLRFEQHCEGLAPALHGFIRWSAADTRQPPPPQNPPPANLWSPSPGATPASGNFVYLQSDQGDFIGQGQTHVLTAPASVLQMQMYGSELGVSVQGSPAWSGYFIPMVPLSRLQVGYYGNLTPRNIAKGSFLWSGDGRACNPYGWFVVDQVTFAADVLTAIDIRFEQHCDNATPAMHGQIHWRLSDQ